MWHKSNRVFRKKPASAFHHDPWELVQELLDGWAAQSCVTCLPAHIQESLYVQEDHRALRLMTALLEDDEDPTPITEEELRRALARS
ncbi:hypothetical protein E2C01_039859 [Portunus trituberculatus]|uniref:Uncharacterized protein n=1 Tax=Portunus trituberculatus TaxID=210409 RepID=A0A5B7FFV4_PORTR|nr:hypothetical protein [Portunus trituberculatus]